MQPASWTTLGDADSHGPVGRLRFPASRGPCASVRRWADVRSVQDVGHGFELPLCARSIAASRTVVLSMEELARRGIVRSPIEWRGHVFPVAGVREWQATERELEHVASTLATQAHDALEAIERVVSFMTMGVCLARSLCKLFGTDGESDNIKGLCRCSVCSPVCPSF